MAPSQARSIPIISGLAKLTIGLVMIVLWQPTNSFWWWVESFLFAFLVFIACGELKRGFLASDTEIERIVNGEYDAKD
jgi:hypothetical protein